MGLDSLYCGKWRTISKSRHEIDLDRDNAQCRTRPRYFHILQYVQVSSQLNHYFFSYRVHRHTDTQTDRHADRQTDRQTDRRTDTHTDGDEYSIVAVDKPQL